MLIAADGSHSYVRELLFLGTKPHYAGFILRPHTAASTSKAASSAMDLSEALAENKHDVLVALQAWEPRQMSLGQHLMESGLTLGNRSQFSYGRGRCLVDDQEN
ncbi:hypothetical protein BN59_01630 [Legionella massiliensis]|uniref:Uncharacterized protein n=1 Tax=Legionella massiliensis TaxID=1034943 RepID=A0A078KWH0_9GAMM|nr:hypothetical protein BN59_01630 [Legionella massiliensis]CEE13085.1 hypothetical protein BN1094_01630 [Legionella massiliensis]